MANYTRSTNFTAKDALASGNPSKIILGSEHDTEYDAIATAIATKLDSNGSAASLTALPAAQGGSMALLNRTAASGASAVTWGSSIFTSSYDRWYIQISNMSFSTTANFYMQFSTDNGSSWIASTNNMYARFGTTAQTATGGNVQNVSSTGDSAINFGTGFTTTYRVSTEMFIDIGTHSVVRVSLSFFANGVQQGYVVGMGGVSSVANAFRILPSTGTISGNFAIYGIKNS